ncbi:MAG: CopG family transcriptional regulator [Betaproteobacteria bacterium]|nr:MAG: CopG family transcriptional regulator [Betaproteobacteria bacterium]
MSAKIRYTDEPLGKPKVVADFLPAPEDLVFRDEGKQEAAKHNTQYQRMIRRLLDVYAEHHARPVTSRSTRTRHRRAG